MAIIARAKSKKNYPPHPEGTFAGVCCDVVDLGEVETEWQGKTRKSFKVLIYWQTPETYEYTDPDTNETVTKRHIVWKRYTNSLDKKANLRKDLESWRGKGFTEDELKGFDLEVLLGVNAILSIVHNESDGVTYANVASVAKPMKGMEAIEVKDYIRTIDRDDSESNESENNSDEAVDDPADNAPSDDLPF